MIPSIGDLVWFDDNENGVQDSGELGISGARVRLDLDPDTVTIIPLAEPISMTVVTGADGRYLVEGLVPGTYTVTLDQSSVTGSLTTPASYVVDLGLDVVYLDADFGVAPDIGGLPFTGVWGIPEMIILASILVLGGGAVILRSRRRGADQGQPTLDV